MARIDAAYDYFLTTYGNTIGSRYEAHKKSELRDTYNSIIKANKEAPLYKIKQTSDLGQFAIDIKEAANSIYNSVSNLTSHGEDISSVLEKRIAYSSDDEAISARFIGDENSASDDFTIEVESLAQPQANLGNFLAPNAKGFEDGTYSFDLDTKSGSYEFQFNVGKNDNNIDVQRKLARLINSSDVGLTADVISNKNNETALYIVSKATGLSDDESSLFNIQSGTSWREINILGIQNIHQEAKNSSFKLNGIEHFSLSNTFTVNKSFELSLKKPTDGAVRVGLMNDTDALSQGINQLLSGYNTMMDIGLKYSNNHQNNTLLNDFSAVSNKMAASLEKVGITPDETGKLSLDKDVLSAVINSEDRDTAFNTLNNLRDSIKNLAKKASINPMNYLDKIVVEYKNPSKTFAFPYATSQYSGLLVDYGL